MRAIYQRTLHTLSKSMFFVTFFTVAMLSLFYPNPSTVTDIPGNLGKLSPAERYRLPELQYEQIDNPTVGLVEYDAVKSRKSHSITPRRKGTITVGGHEAQVRLEATLARERKVAADRATLQGSMSMVTPGRVTTHSPNERQRMYQQYTQRIRDGRDKGKLNDEVYRMLVEEAEKLLSERYSVTMTVLSLDSMLKSEASFPSMSGKSLYSPEAGVVVTSHANGLVKGLVYDGHNATRFVLPDDALPEKVLAQVRRFDLAHSRKYRSTYFVLLMLLPTSFGLERLVRRLSKVGHVDVKAIDVAKGELEESRHLLKVRMEALRATRLEQGIPTSSVPTAAPRSTSPLNWSQAFVITIALCCLAFAVGWVTYLNPTGSRESMAELARLLNEN